MADRANSIEALRECLLQQGAGWNAGCHQNDPDGCWMREGLSGELRYEIHGR